MPITSQDKELGHVPHLVRSVQLRPARDKGKSCNFAFDSRQKRLPATLAPIQWKIGITKAPILPYIDRNKLAEIVDVQLQKILQAAPMLQSCSNYFDTRRHAPKLTARPLY